MENAVMTLAQKIVNEALSLEKSDRAVVIHLLLQSLEDPVDHQDKWLALAEKRRQDYKSGKVQLVNWKHIESNVRGK